MQDDKYKKILEKDYQDLISDVVRGIIVNDDQPKALELVKVLEKALEANFQTLQSDARLSAFYKDLTLKLRFIALPSLDDKNIFSLFKDNFCFQFGLEEYELSRKLNIKMLSLLVIEDRNKFKEEIRKALTENSEKITSQSEIKTVKDWLKDYLVKVGLESQDKLARAQYMMEL